MTRKRFWVAWIVGGALIVALAAAAVALARLTPRLADELAATLAAKTGKPVSLRELDWKVVPRLRFQGRGLLVGAEGDALFASIDEFDVEAGWLDLMAKPRRIQRIVLRRAVVRSARRTDGAPPQPPAAGPEPEKTAPPLAIDQIEVVDLRVERQSGQAEKPPQVFEIRKLLLTSFDLSRPSPFQALLGYPRPPGDLEIQGEFGPWDLDRPAATPYRASFHFSNADLSVFGGIRGILDAAGTFEGSTDETRVSGEAAIPDFALKKPESVVPLRNRFRATVLERGRRILLEEVTTEFFQSRLVTTGEVSAPPEGPGRDVNLRVEGRQARVEDLTRFALSSDTPPLTGAIVLETSVSIPAGPAGFQERMRVQGNFKIADGRFSNVSIQDTLAKISRAGGGESEAGSGSSVVSDMSGDFVLERGVLDFSRLSFGVPGVRMDLTGSYTFAGEALDFRGTALLDRAPSELAPKGLGQWIKLIDPLFRKGESGTSLPVTIRGTRSKPLFRIDFRRIGRD